MKLLILEGFLPQGSALAKVFKESDPKSYIESRNDKKNLYDIILQISTFNIYDAFSYKENFVSQNDFLKFDYVIPTGARSTKALLNTYNKIKYNDFLIDKTMLVSYKKIRMLEIVKNLDIPTPKTYLSPEEIKEFPIFYKERSEIGIRGIRGIAFRKEDIPKRCNLLYQEYISSPYTFGVGFLAQDGEILTHFIHREILSTPPIGGSGVIVEAYEDSVLVDYTQRIVKELNYNGWGLAEYKYNPKIDDYVFMEINSKWWASCIFHFFNNPKFLKIPFGVDFKQKKVIRAIFLNRLLELGPLFFIRNIHQLTKSKIFVDRIPIIETIEFILPDFAKNYIWNLFRKNKVLTDLEGEKYENCNNC
ncbi:MAG: hypothetical protein QXS37_06040 [Candidatus Aenigmatarchaeota archaeon]